MMPAAPLVGGYTRNVWKESRNLNVAEGVLVVFGTSNLADTFSPLMIQLVR